MIHSRSYTSATSSDNAFARPNTALLWTLLALSAAALLLRSFRLGWQPLWWDEGYSIYFATEPLPRMVWLTARDIHPPLYYALLHVWLALVDSAAPEPARGFSILCGALAIPALAWFAHSLLPARPRVALLAAFLLAINPLHLYYSQEIRMYGLALLLALLATLAFWRLVVKLRSDTAASAMALPWLAYVIGSTLALYTVYYTGFLLAAHCLWAGWRFRRAPRALFWLAGAALAILLLQAPWWSYTLPKLIPYVADKVIADQDTALPPWDYLWRHAVAFTGGHLPASWPWLEAARIGGVITLALLPLPWRKPGHNAGEASTQGDRDIASALAAFTLVPLLLGFLVNLRLPFFPDGGERLLLFVLPYLLLWLAWAWSLALERRTAWSWLGLPVILAAVAGLVTFYTVPRYSDHDYRPLIRYVTQHSRATDTVFAIFPWQVGYWRAYGVRSNGGWLPPQPAPLGQQALEWGPAVEEQLSAALAEGTVWFPAPLSFGSRLPGQVEGYLSAHARNLESRWFSPATRLSAWTALSPPAASPATALPADFGAVTLLSAAAGPSPVTADNHPLAVDLTWDTLPAEP
ncbi:MAG TPA: hypothetical protein VNK95_02860 [Caldilineaceae bacterium]|nr:hypothetical protein [Caldilineaceae bacterium]